MFEGLWTEDEILKFRNFLQITPQTQNTFQSFQLFTFHDKNLDVQNVPNWQHCKKFHDFSTPKSLLFCICFQNSFQIGLSILNVIFSIRYH